MYQDTDNFDDNPLAWFSQYQTAPPDTPLAKKGMSYVGLDSFYEAAANGTLPEVSFIVGPAELSEHPPYMPKDGAWLQQQVVNAVTNSPKYASTVLIISYDGMVYFRPAYNSTLADGNQNPVVLETTLPHSTLQRIPQGIGWRIHMVSLEMCTLAQVSFLCKKIVDTHLC